jgi:riboflavin kinase/FMN adenylyltransferase
MAIYYPGRSPRPRLHKPVITIGTFDGVHLGHRLILEDVMRHAAAIGGESMVITFEPHPRQVLQPQSAIQILTPLPDKLDLIMEAGIQHVAVTPFTVEFSELSATAYIEDFLVKEFHPAAIVIGYDHHFGHDRRGNIALLRKYSKALCYEVHEIPAHMISDAAISSTRIRQALQSGEVRAAVEMLGRPYPLRGTVVGGEKLGRTLGYPTINVQPLYADQLIPAQGVYAARISVEGVSYGAMLSIGTRPTVSSEGKVTIEAFLFDFDREIYGQEVALQFIQRMRDELKFDSLDTLKDALRQDERDARMILGLL